MKMTDLNKPTEAETTNTATQTEATDTTNPSTSETKGRCGWNSEQWMAHRGQCHGKSCHGKRRFKVIGGALLIFFLGVMAGKGCSHHHEMHHSAMKGSEATVVVRGEKPKPLSVVLDSIQATPEQRAKAADLVY
jgi:hypothetical protein